jgi:tetratricopeptide (TPR) repeat protein
MLLADGENSDCHMKTRCSLAVLTVALAFLLGCGEAHDEGYEARAAVGEGNLLLWKASGGHVLEPATIADPPKVDADVHAEAMEQFDRAIELDPESSDAWFARAVARIYTDNYSAAIDDLTEAIRLDEASAKAWYYRSLAYKASGNEEKAQEDLAEALKLDSAIAGAPAEGEAAAGATAAPTP